MRFDSKDSSELAKKQLALDLDLQNHIPRPHVDLENDGLGRDYRKHILATNRVDTSMLDHRSAVVINIWRVQNGSLRHPLIVLGVGLSSTILALLFSIRAPITNFQRSHPTMQTINGSICPIWDPTMPWRLCSTMNNPSTVDASFTARLTILQPLFKLETSLGSV